MQLLHLLPWLRKEGWQVGLAAPEHGPISRQLEASGIPVFIDKTFLTDASHTRLAEICAQFDFVVANTIVSWPVVRVAHRLKAPVIWYLHETLVAVRLMGQIPEIQPTLRMANLLVTPTDRTADVYRDISDTPVTVAPYGIPPPPPLARKVKHGPREFATLGSFEPRKGQDVLLEAIALLDGSSPSFFRMAGRVLDADFFARLQTAAAALPNVALLNALDHAAAMALLHEADVLISPSRDETMPVVILEAMGAGKAVITTDVGGVREWIHNELNGLVVPPENPEALAAAVARCAKDRELVEQQRRFTADASLRRVSSLSVSETDALFGGGVKP